MGQLALAAKITHVPSMYLSELDGPHKGCRQAAIDGHHEIGRRCRALGVDTIVVFDTHWLVNANYHINCAPKFGGTYTSNELPHFISNLAYAFPGNPELGQLLARVCNEHGVEALAHHFVRLTGPEDGWEPTPVWLPVYWWQHRGKGVLAVLDGLAGEAPETGWDPAWTAAEGQVELAVVRHHRQ